jgi:hypothetical protein
VMAAQLAQEHSASERSSPRSTTRPRGGLRRPRDRDAVPDEPDAPTRSTAYLGIPIGVAAPGHGRPAATPAASTMRSRGCPAAPAGAASVAPAGAGPDGTVRRRVADDGG